MQSIMIMVLIKEPWLTAAVIEQKQITTLTKTMATKVTMIKCSSLNKISINILIIKTMLCIPDKITFQIKSKARQADILSDSTKIIVFKINSSHTEAEAEACTKVTRRRALKEPKEEVTRVINI